MILNCKFAMSNGTGNRQLLALIDSNALLKFMSSSVTRRFYRVIKLNTTLVLVRLANRTEVRSSYTANGLN